MEGENSGRVEQINGIHISGESDVSFLVKLHNNQTDRWLPCEEIATAFNEKHLDDYLRRESKFFSYILYLDNFCCALPRGVPLPFFTNTDTFF